jgi:malate dehydrogenase (oxaloacetate-decarboxylating)
MSDARIQKKKGEEALALHKKLGGKMQTQSRVRVTKDSLPLLYTPGVGAVSSLLAQHPRMTRAYTGAGRTIAVVSDGSAVLGLGNIGPYGALPVLEGKALLFKELAGVDAVPLALRTQDPDEIVRTIQLLAPNFAGINLEDIAAPACFAIERQLIETLDIPVMHDDQHGTAIVVLAGLINAFAVVQKNILRSRVAVIGAGAAGTAIAHLLVRYGVGDVVVVDRGGIVGTHRTDLTPEKKLLAQHTNRECRMGGVVEAVVGADALVGVSGPGSVWVEHVRVMAQRPIVFALANPTPEIMPDEARAGGAVVVATGRSDFPNQINNALVFPGVFRGVLNREVRMITTDMHIRVAKKLAGLVAHPTANKIIPTLFDRRVVKVVAEAIR